MEISMYSQNGIHSNFPPSTSSRDVRYSCGFCGYELNLSSSNRNISTIGSKYSKSIKRGVISFFDVDESRFTQVKEFQCIPYFFRHRTKLLCGKCGHHIGTAYKKNNALSDSLVSAAPESPSCNQVTTQCKYNVRIRALQPSSSEESRVSLFVQD